MLFEHLSMEFNHVGRLRFETDDVDTAGKGLEVGIWANGTEFIHDVKSIFLAVEVARLEAGASTCFEPADAGIIGGFDCGHEVLGKNASTDNRLKAIAECRAHELNCFLVGHGVNPNLWG